MIGRTLRFRALRKSSELDESAHPRILSVRGSKVLRGLLVGVPAKMPGKLAMYSTRVRGNGKSERNMPSTGCVVRWWRAASPVC
jgi:hypothetical protein